MKSGKQLEKKSSSIERNKKANTEISVTYCHIFLELQFFIMSPILQL